jgi:divalent metal cation (Fe/Co/Zn/Cd) transporter
LLIGVSTVVESVRRLVAGASSHASQPAIVIAASSAVVLVVLTVWKRAVARRLESEALRADSLLSFTGAGLAVIAVFGTTLVSRTDIGWIDPLAALVIAVAAATGGVAALRREEVALLRPLRRRRIP